MNISTLLQEAVESGIIDITTVQDKVCMRKREEYLQNHKYNVWQATDGRYCTYIPDKKKGRKLIKKKEKKDVEDAICEYYENESDNNKYIVDVFEEWITEKHLYNDVKDSTIERYKSDFKRFFVDSEISEKRFCDIDEVDLENFIKSTIKKKKLTHKKYAMLRILIVGIFKFGKSKKYTQLSITAFLEDLYISKGLFAKSKKKNDDEEVFNEEEVRLLTEYFKTHPTKRHIGLLLQFQTGMRVGEISALKPCDVSTKCIYVRRTEQKSFCNETNKTILVVNDTTKTDAGERTIILPESSRETMLYIISRSGEEYLFEDNDGRISSRKFCFSLKKACKKLDIPYRSTHKIRKTYASTLLKNGVSEDTVKTQLGHASIITTQNIYRFNTENADKIQEEISKAINI